MNTERPFPPTPFIGSSPLTGKHYIVTRLRKDGTAAVKVDVSDQVEAIVLNRCEALAREYEIACKALEAAYERIETYSNDRQLIDWARQQREPQT